MTTSLDVALAETSLHDQRLVELTLTNIYGDVESDIDRKIENAVKNAFSVCATAESNNNDDNKKISERLTKSVMRFLRLNDKYCALSSTILKSMSYHDTFMGNNRMGDEEDTNITMRKIRLP
eukprot:2698604-Ditylum_brightwellii.AAC.1